MKYKLGPAIIAGVLALSSGVSQAADDVQAKDRSQYVQTKLTEGLVSVAAIGIGQQRSREYTDQKVDYLHRVTANEYSLKRMNDSDQPLTDWLDSSNQEWKSLQSQDTRLSVRISNANKRLRPISMTQNPVLYAKLENEIRNLKGELEKSHAQIRMIERRNKALAVWARTGQGDIQLADHERKAIKAFYKMKREMITESTDLTKKAVVAELKSAATMVAYAPAAIVVGTTVNDMMAASKKMEKAQASSQSTGGSSGYAQGATSEAAR